MFEFSDEEILRDIRLGIPNNAQAIGWLYENVRPMIWSVGRKYGLVLDEDIEDLINDVMVDFIQDIRKNHFNAKSSITTYLYAIAKNKAFNRLRKRKYFDSLERNIDVESSSKFDSPEAIIFLAEKSRLLEDLMSLLSDKCRNVIQLQMDEPHLSQAEIAKRLNISSSQYVATLSYRCRQKLSNQILDNPILLGKLMDLFDDPYDVHIPLIKYSKYFHMIIEYCKGANLVFDDSERLKHNIESDPDLEKLISFIKSILNQMVSF